jgi:hypothetical protein
VGSPAKFHTIEVSELHGDGQWHKYSIDTKTLDNWRESGGQITAAE